MAGGDEVVSDSGDVDGVPGDDGVCEQVEAVGLVVLVVVSPTADLASITDTSGSLSDALITGHADPHLSLNLSDIAPFVECS